jgi:hypothetical protein
MYEKQTIQNYILLEYDAVKFGRLVPVSWKNVLLPSSRYKVMAAMLGALVPIQ